MSSRSILDQSIRRLKPEKHLKALAYRDRSQLPFLFALKAPYPKLLADTTFYIDALQGRLPREAGIVARAGNLWHSSVTESELSALIGLLDPRHPDTAVAIREISASIDARLPHRVLTPDRDNWREAGILAGMLARLQGYAKNDRRKTINDALIFLTAIKHGCAVLTRNVSDFDLLMQLDGRGRAVFYDRI